MLVLLTLPAKNFAALAHARLNLIESQTVLVLKEEETITPGRRAVLHRRVLLHKMFQLKSVVLCDFLRVSEKA
jgi:hypothetical protein